MNKILSTLGLCMRSGNLSSGDFAVSEAVRKNACLVIVAMDASENTKRNFEICATIIRCLFISGATGNSSAMP